MANDYSGSKEWETCQIAYSRAQLDYPEGLGVRKVIQMKRMYLGWQPLWQVSPQRFREFINRLRDEWQKEKRKREN